MEIDATLLMKPGVIIKEKNRVFWQGFVYENLLAVFFHWDWVGHADECCVELANHPKAHL